MTGHDLDHAVVTAARISTSFWHAKYHAGRGSAALAEVWYQIADECIDALDAMALTEGESAEVQRRADRLAARCWEAEEQYRRDTFERL